MTGSQGSGLLITNAKMRKCNFFTDLGAFSYQGDFGCLTDRLSWAQTRETIVRGYAPCHHNPNTPINVLREKNFELNIFSKSYNENADQSKRKKAFLLGERTQTQRKVVEFHKKFYNSPKPWFVEKKMQNAILGIFQRVVTEMEMSVLYRFTHWFQKITQTRQNVGRSGNYDDW
jgi:hypothetical protein